MYYVSEIFERANLKQICNFLLYGAEVVEVSDKSYEERIKEADSQIRSIIKEKLTNHNTDDEIERVINDISNYGIESEQVYMEIGIQCGAMLAMELFKID